MFLGFTTTIHPVSTALSGSSGGLRAAHQPNWRCPCPSEYVLGNAFDMFCRFAFPLLRLEGGYFLLFHCFHSRISRVRECNWSVFEECILCFDSDQNAKGRFFKFPFPLSKNQGMAFAESGRFHSSLPKTQEWFLAKQSFSTPARQNPGNGFHPNNLFPPSASNVGLL